MIELYSGTPGSGKSLHAASSIIWHLRMKRPLICNFDIKHNVKNYNNYFTYIPNDKITPDTLVTYSRNYFNGKNPKEDEIMLILDECQLLFNARDWNKSGRDKWLSFYTQHRKYGYHIILIAQFDRMIDRQIRSLIEYNYIHRKVSNMGWQGSLLNLVMGGKTFVSVKMWYPLNEKVGQNFIHARKKLYTIYDTYNDFNTDNHEVKKPDCVVTVGVGVPGGTTQIGSDHVLLTGGLKIQGKSLINSVHYWVKSHF